MSSTTLAYPATGQVADAPLRRRVPPLGGFNLTALGIELRRMLRNRRTVIFTLIFPATMLFVIGGSVGDVSESVGNGNVAAYLLVSMALYGAAMTAASSGAMVALERAQGWSRQLRLTPLRPVAYIVMKALVALTMGAVAVATVNIAAAVEGDAHMPFGLWLASALLTLLCSLTFAALGVFIGYLLPGENAMQVIGLGLAVLAFLGGLFYPLTEGSALWHVAIFTPVYGVAEVVRAPLTGELPWYAVLNAIVWLAIFVGGAAWRMSKDTARV